ncbi:hypothetical protein BDP67DRAFT_155275 [Colletotrichum lupini]|nr:hypothetical protein BDP67DRAFT_155275 [Colletotrichum lupini]
MLIHHLVGLVDPVEATEETENTKSRTRLRNLPIRCPSTLVDYAMVFFAMVFLRRSNPDLGSIIQPLGFVPESQFRKSHLSIGTGIRPSISPATQWRGIELTKQQGKKEFGHAGDRLVINLFGSHSTPPSPSQFANQWAEKAPDRSMQRQFVLLAAAQSPKRDADEMNLALSCVVTTTNLYRFSRLQTFTLQQRCVGAQLGSLA